MPSDWSWWDAWKAGDDDAFQRSLDQETDRSLDRDPGRWSWGKRVDETSTHSPHEQRGRFGGHHDRDWRNHRDRDGRGGESERSGWKEREWDHARGDYLRQNRNYLDDRERRELEDRDRGEGRGIFW